MATRWMGRIGRSVLLATAVMGPSAAWAHSSMFPDDFRYDPSNGGEGLSLSKLSALSMNARTVCQNGSAGGYPCLNIDLLAFVPRATMGNGSNLSDIWGWTDPVTGQEIALVTHVDGVTFVDVTDGENPVVLGFLPTADGVAAWRDVKVYSDHAFIVADGSANNTHGLQVFDLTQLRSVSSPPVTFSETARMTDFGNAHNVIVNEDSGFAYVVGSNTCSGGLFMVDVSVPTDPTFAGCFSLDGYTHDAQCVIYAGPDSTYRDREICVAYNEDTVTIVDVSDKSNPTQISRTPYAGSEYTHQGWFLDDTHSIILVDDELDEQRNGGPTRTYIFDVQDLDAPAFIGVHQSTVGAVDHNLYVRNGIVYQANYRAGLRILTTENIAAGQLNEIAFFDSIPGSDSAQFSGAWSSYIYFDSGNVIFSDIGNGLFVVDPDLTGSPPPPPPPATCDSGALNLSDTQAYASNNTGSFSVSPDGCTIDLSGNIWRITNQTFSINANTVVTFDFASDGTGEIQGVGFDEDTTSSSNRVFRLTGTQNWGISDFTYTGNGAVQRITIPVGQYYTGTMGFVIANDNDSGSGNTVTVGNVVISESGPPPSPECIVEDFESGIGGWANAASATCSTGAFVVGTPTQVVNSGVTTQVAGASSGTAALFTAANTSAGVDDVDGGVCIVESPRYDVSGASTVTFAHFHGQRDPGDDPNGDFYRVEVSSDGGATFQTVASTGDSTSNASWVTGSIDVPSGASVVVRMQCADGTLDGDLIECGIDNLRICPR